MRFLITSLLILVCLGCETRVSLGSKPTTSEASNTSPAKWKVTFHRPSNGSPVTLVWETTDEPHINTYGTRFTTTDGQRVRIQGSVVVEEVR